MVAPPAAHDSELICENAADLAELHMREAERLAGREPTKAADHAELYHHYLSIETDLASNSESREAQARALRNRAKFERTNGTAEASIPLYEDSLHFMDEGVSSHQFLIPYAKALRLVGRSDEAMTEVRKVLDWSRQIGAPRSEAIARQYLGLLLLEDAIKDPNPDLADARAQLERAVALHREVGFKQGVRETTVDLFDLEVSAGNLGAALLWLSDVDAFGGGIEPSDVQQTISAVVAELVANGDRPRAARVRRTVDLLVQQS